MAVNFAKQSLLNHIKALNLEIRDRLHEWLDGDPNAIHELIEAAACEQKLYAIGWIEQAEDPGPHEWLKNKKLKPNFHMMWGPSPDFEKAKEVSLEDSFDQTVPRNYYMLRCITAKENTFKPIRRLHKGRWTKLDRFKG